MGEEKGQKIKTEIKEETTEIKEEIEESEENIVEDKSVKMAKKTNPKQWPYRQRQDSEPMEGNSDNESNSSSSSEASDDDKAEGEKFEPLFGFCFSNFSCRILNPNIFFQIWIIIVLNF